MIYKDNVWRPQNENITPAAQLGPDDAPHSCSLTAAGYPVRKKYPQAASERLTISSDDITEDSLDEIKEDGLSEKNEDVCRSSKRLLPDRTHAAHNRANEKLVHFIVKQRMVERHLLVGFIRCCIAVVLLGVAFSVLFCTRHSLLNRIPQSVSV